MGGTDDAVCVNTHTLERFGGMLPQKNFYALRSLLRSYSYPNPTNPTRVHGRSNTAVCHDACQSSQGISVAVVDLVCVGPDWWASYIYELMTWTRTVSTLANGSITPTMYSSRTKYKYGLRSDLRAPNFLGKHAP